MAVSALDRNLWRQGKIVAGVDEVGKGCIAGPVYAAAVILNFKAFSQLDKGSKELVRDSKTLSQAQRARIVKELTKVIAKQGIASASVIEIESLGIQDATYLAMRRALALLEVQVDLVLVDGKHLIRGYQGDQQAIIGGDGTIKSIASASILAKESRDFYMREQSKLFARYDFYRHVGYGTAKHLSLIAEYGICPLHRRNFEPIKSMLTKWPESKTI